MAVVAEWFWAEPKPEARATDPATITTPAAKTIAVVAAPRRLPSMSIVLSIVTEHK